MYNSGKIIAGLVIALFVLTFPVWYNLGAAVPPAPDPKIAPQAKAAGRCVLPKAEIKTGHMQLLDDWRNAVVRDSRRFYLEIPGEKGRRPELVVIEGAKDYVANTLLSLPVIGPARNLVSQEDNTLNTGEATMVEMSLQNTCMACHTSKKEFCDQCHNYANVTPFCWDCHVEPKEKE